MDLFKVNTMNVFKVNTMDVFKVNTMKVFNVKLWICITKTVSYKISGSELSFPNMSFDIEVFVHCKNGNPEEFILVYFHLLRNIWAIYD